MADLTIAQFQELIRERFFKTDSKRGTPGTFMWLIEEVGELATGLQACAEGQDPTAEQSRKRDGAFDDALAGRARVAEATRGAGTGAG